MSVSRELRANVAHIVRHAAQDGMGDGFGGVAARGPVAVDLLNPFEVDYRDDADLEVGILRYIHVAGDDCAMQALVK